MAFAFPWARAGELVDSLRGTQRGGIRYPIPAYLRYTGEFPEKYRRLDAMWQETAERPEVLRQTGQEAAERADVLETTGDEERK
jgi:hypothetical protein